MVRNPQCPRSKTRPRRGESALDRDSIKGAPVDIVHQQAAYTDGDVDTNNSPNEHLWDMVESHVSRRQTMTGIAAASAAFMGSGLLAGCSGDTLDEFEQPGGTVSAGADIATSSGRMVTLAGTTAGDVIGTGGFTQVSGPPVTLTNAGSANASFIAPSVNAPTAFTFRYSGTGSAGQPISDEVTVTVSPAALGFTAVAKNRNDVVTVPDGYTMTILYRTGDPILPGVAAYKNDGTDTNFAGRAGDHHDGMYYYGLNSAGTARQDDNSQRGLLVMNHENINEQYLHPNGASPAPRPAGEAVKEIEAHGVSVVEVSRGANGAWSYSQASTFNRRITPNTPVQFNGPVRGHPLLRTKYSADGTQGRGTINNCAMGFFLWGTFVTCEENWAGYFRRPASDNAARSAREQTSLRRYGVSNSTGNFSWSSATPTADIYQRWDATAQAGQPADGTGDYRNEPYQFGWCVEIDPYDPASRPRKRTALGRMGHEGAWHGQWVAGRKVTAYLGDDARNEYFYKFVSATAWNPADAQAADRLAIGDKYLDNGTLYVARFNADGTGTWLPLVFGQVPNRPATTNSTGAVVDPVYVFADQSDILINPRLAADAVGATKMDRPEWTGTDNRTGEIYLTLTNNRTTERPLAATDAANPRHYLDPKLPGTATPTAPQSPYGNPNGHILRLREGGDNSESLTFTWDIYLFGADSADSDAANVNLSGLTAENDFSSPDGLWFSRPQNPAGQGNRQLLWIQTDDGAFTDRTNNQMLAALPGNTRDGGPRTITNRDAAGNTRQQLTHPGAAATPATLRRFTVGPIECEITGIDSTPDGRTIFYNIQHPGETGSPTAPTSQWPSSQGSGPGPRPRSATVVVTKNDGGVVGL
jgi:secreted PhoX family phosphatase